MLISSFTNCTVKGLDNFWGVVNLTRLLALQFLSLRDAVELAARTNSRFLRVTLAGDKQPHEKCRVVRWFDELDGEEDWSGVDDEDARDIVAAGVGEFDYPSVVHFYRDGVEFECYDDFATYGTRRLPWDTIEKAALEQA